MKQKLKSVIKGAKVIALAGLASVALGCGSSPKSIESQPIKSGSEVTNAAARAMTTDRMNPVVLAGKSLDSYFTELNKLNPTQQEYLAKTLNNLPVWDTILLARYVPVDSTLKELSSFYSTDYKGFLQTILSKSGLNPMTVGLTGDKGLGQLTPLAENWARSLYNNKKLEYKFSGAEITDNVFDPRTNLVLSSILFRKGSEEKVSDLDALWSLYSNGLKGVKLKDNAYVANDLGLNAVERAKSFDNIADKMMIFSWISLNNPDLKKHIEDANLRKLLEDNNGTYEGKPAYEGMVTFLNSISTNSKKYSEDNKKMFRDETANISGWIKKIYGN